MFIDLQCAFPNQPDCPHRTIYAHMYACGDAPIRMPCHALTCSSQRAEADALAYQEMFKANLDQERALLEDKLRQEMSARKRAEDEAKRAEELAAERVEAIKAEAARLEREAAATSNEKAELDRERRMLQQKLADESSARERAMEDKKRAEAESLSRLDEMKSEKERIEAAMKLEKDRLEREARAIADAKRQVELDAEANMSMMGQTMGKERLLLEAKLREETAARTRAEVSLDHRR